MVLVVTEVVVFAVRLRVTVGVVVAVAVICISRQVQTDPTKSFLRESRLDRALALALVEHVVVEEDFVVVVVVVVIARF